MIDWTKPVCTKHDIPHIGNVLEDCPVTGRKRVQTASPSSLGGPPTTFRYDADGTTRGDGQPSDNDLVNFDHDDRIERVAAPRAL